MSKAWHYFAYAPEGSSAVEINVDGQARRLDSIENTLLDSYISCFIVPDALTMAIERWAVSGNSDNGHQMRNVGRCNFTNYGALDLQEQIDWSMGQPGQDNLSWQLHSFAFLRDLASAYLVEADDWYISRIKQVVEQWARENIRYPPSSSFSWDDHTTALRLTVIGQLLAFMKVRNLLDVDFFRKCVGLVYRHQQVLLCENFYVRGTNHGLDQAFALYQSTLVFDMLENSAQTKQVALQRLAYEVGKSFSDDFVHIENSPAYHDVMLSSVLQVNRFVESFEGDGGIVGLEDFINGALDYLAYVIRPDGRFPPIGDTLMALPRNNFEWLKGYDSYKRFLYSRTKGQQGVDAVPWHRVFPHSGYAIFRGNPALFSMADRPHIVFKCGFLSYYHRQDDDNNFLVFAFGEEWLTDGGLYKHDHHDPQREHLRSHFAHNVMAPAEGKADRRHCPSPASMIHSFSVDDMSPWVCGVSTMFPGYTYQRTLAYDGEYKLSVEDRIAPTIPASESLTYEQYWQIPADKSVDISSASITIRSQQTGQILVVEFASANLIALEEIQPGEGSYFGWRSVEYGKLERVRTIRLVFRGVGPVEACTSLVFCGGAGEIKGKTNIKKNIMSLARSLSDLALAPIVSAVCPA